MGIIGWFFYIVLSIVFFFILQYFQNHYSITKMEKLILSILGMMIVSGICYRFLIPYTDNIFLVFSFLFIIDILYHSYFIEKDFFDKNEKNVLYYILLILVSFFVNQEFINKVHQVFLTGEELRSLLWFLGILFVYYFCKNHGIFMRIDNSKVRTISQEMVLVQYAKFKYRFYDDCAVENRDLSNLLYALMIFHNSHRSRILRKYDYFCFRINGSKRPLGIMQIETKKFISDSESIALAYKKLERIYEKVKGKKKAVSIEDVILNYDKEHASEIQSIFDIIKKF